MANATNTAASGSASRTKTATNPPVNKLQRTADQRKATAAFGARSAALATSSTTPTATAPQSSSDQAEMRSKRVLPDPEGSPDQIREIQAQLSAMAAMFDRERRNTEAQMAQEQVERKKYADKVLHLEETLEEQKRVAKESKREVGRRRTLFDDEMAMLRQSHARERQTWEEDLERERRTVKALKDSMAEQSAAHLTLEASGSALRSDVQQLRDQVRNREQEIQQLQSLVEAKDCALNELQADLRDAETLRRKLHNEVQELRGNIRVFARIRPPPPNRDTATLANLRFPNPKEARGLEILAAGESATGTATMRSFGFEFDRVFGPESTQANVFDEVQHLMQSTLDGYNTCIFAYGQTGSGKTHTLEGSGLPHANYDLDATSGPPIGAGLIPRAVQMLFAVARDLQDKGWSYDFHGSMLEIYNDNINDLLGKAKVDEGRHEIKHEKGRTVVTDVVVLPLRSPSEVFHLLTRASARRSVAATLMNERSSRSHSVFTLRVRGSNPSTLESCDSTMSLVDLAGSERLATSGSGDDPSRLKEAVSINKSLSALADVIQALGAGKGATATGHVPYRNSTLTWLLKNSLGGNSKTLMLASVSPMAEHLSESLSTLRFATKVNSTVIGTARRQKSAGGDGI
ncbi:unnamed protein product [Parajaminaea phylloscopi]